MYSQGELSCCCWSVRSRAGPSSPRARVAGRAAAAASARSLAVGRPARRGQVERQYELAQTSKEEGPTCIVPRLRKGGARGRCGWEVRHAPGRERDKARRAQAHDPFLPAGCTSSSQQSFAPAASLRVEVTSLRWPSRRVVCPECSAAMRDGSHVRAQRRHTRTAHVPHPNTTAYAVCDDDVLEQTEGGGGMGVRRKSQEASKGEWELRQEDQDQQAGQDVGAATRGRGRRSRGRS